MSKSIKFSKGVYRHPSTQVSWNLSFYKFDGRALARNAANRNNRHQDFWIPSRSWPQASHWSRIRICSIGPRTLKVRFSNLSNNYPYKKRISWRIETENDKTKRWHGSWKWWTNKSCSKSRRNYCLCLEVETGRLSHHRFSRLAVIKKKVIRKGGVAETVNRPVLNKEYSRCMKGTYMMNQREAHYSMYRKVQRWYMRFFQHIIEIASINTFLPYKKVNPKSRMLIFRRKLIETLTEWSFENTKNPR